MILPEEHVQVTDTVRRFADAVVRPIAAELDATARFPEEIYGQMAEQGLVGITVPAELGGAGIDALAHAVVMEELSRGYASVADQGGLVGLIGTLLTRHGTPAQRTRHLGPRLRFARKTACCITEAEAGSDAAGLRTTATRTARAWLAGPASTRWVNARARSVR